MCHSDMWISEDNLWESCQFCETQGLNSHFRLSLSGVISSSWLSLSSLCF